MQRAGPAGAGFPGRDNIATSGYAGGMRAVTYLLGLFLAALTVQGAETVVLLHGLGRGPASMWSLERSLRREGYRVVNVRYPSQRASIAELAEQALGPVFAEASDGVRIHVVTHSLGGIVVRRYLHEHGAPTSLGRVVMLAPPNHGSEIVDTLKSWRIYRWINGPAGLELGTEAESTPLRLGDPPAGVEVGVIAGRFSWNPLFSALIAGADDGKVAVARTHLDGERDHLTLPYSHTWLMNRSETRRQVVAFLREGRFVRAGAASGGGPRPAFKRGIRGVGPR